MQGILSFNFQEDKNTVKRQESRERPRRVMRGLTVDSSHLGKLSNIEIITNILTQIRHNHKYLIMGQTLIKAFREDFTVIMSCDIGLKYLYSLFFIV